MDTCDLRVSGRGKSWQAFPSGRYLPRWNAPATGAPSCTALNPVCSGEPARSAMPNGPVFLYLWCSNAPSR